MDAANPPVIHRKWSLDTLSTVVTTGGSSGIGKSFIEHIAKVNPTVMVCNLSRRDPDIKAGLIDLHHFPCDLSDSADLARGAEAVVATLREQSMQGPVLLINNAGFGGYGHFPEPALDHQLGMIDVNVRAVVALTGRLLPALKARGGAIINVASTAAFQPTAYLATYGATKAFVLHWSLALNEELRGTGVRSLAVCPGPTATEFFRRAGLREGSVAESIGQTSEQVVREALAALESRKALVVTGVKNKLMTAVSSTLPKVWVARIGAAVLKRYRLKKADRS